jgi:hypothetical protein
VEGNCKYSHVASAVVNSRQGVILKFRTGDWVLKLELPRRHIGTEILSCRTVPPPPLISDFTISESITVISWTRKVLGDRVFGICVPRERFLILSLFRFPFVCNIRILDANSGKALYFIIMACFYWQQFQGRETTFIAKKSTDLLRKASCSNLSLYVTASMSIEVNCLCFNTVQKKDVITATLFLIKTPTARLSQVFTSYA